MRYVGSNSELIFGEKITGKIDNKYEFTVLDSAIIVGDSRIPITRRTDKEIIACDDNGNSFRVIITPKGYFALLDVHLDKEYHDVLIIDTIDSNISKPSKLLIKNRGRWTAFAEEAIDYFGDLTYIDIHENTIGVAVKVGTTLVGLEEKIIE